MMATHEEPMPHDDKSRNPALPKVKPLVWEPWADGTSLSRSVFGTYHTWPGYWRAPDSSRGIEAQDPESAAQADYERRVLEALEPGTCTDLAEAETAAAVAAEREGCAEIAENMAKKLSIRTQRSFRAGCIVRALQQDQGAQYCAAIADAIRERRE